MCRGAVSRIDRLAQPVDSVAVSGAATLFANVLRAAALFVLETRDAPVPELLHTGVGAATFALTAVSIVLIESALRRMRSSVQSVAHA